MPKTISTPNKGSETGTAIADDPELEVDPIQLMEEQEAERELMRRKDKENAQAHYLRIIRIEKPSKSQAETLIQVARDLGISSNQLGEDMRIVEDAHRYFDGHQRFRELQQKHHEAQAAYRAFLEHCELEEMALDSIQRHAEHEFRVAHRSATELHRLSRKRPYLFDLTQNPPRLKSTN